jgi:hypothetical protein
VVDYLALKGQKSDLFHFLHLHQIERGTSRIDFQSVEQRLVEYKGWNADTSMQGIARQHDDNHRGLKSRLRHQRRTRRRLRMSSDMWGPRWHSRMQRRQRTMHRRGGKPSVRSKSGRSGQETMISTTPIPFLDWMDSHRLATGCSEGSDRWPCWWGHIVHWHRTFQRSSSYRRLQSCISTRSKSSRVRGRRSHIWP